MATASKAKDSVRFLEEAKAGRTGSTSIGGIYTIPSPSTSSNHTAMIQTILDNAPAGAEIHWTPNSEYIISGTHALTSTKPHTHIGHGARIRRNASEYATLPTSGSAMLRYAAESNTGTFAGVPVTAGQTTFVVPDEEPLPSIGDLVIFRSVDVRVSAGNYMYGWHTWVRDLSGRTITLGVAFPFAMSVVVLVYNSGVMRGTRIEGLIIDQSNQPSITPMPDHTGIVVHGYDTEIDNCEFIGSGFSTVGLRLRGLGGHVARSRFWWYYNQTGLQGGGRVGYGVQVQANNVTVDTGCQFVGCKHSVVFGGDRDVVYQGATFRGNRVIEVPTMANATDATNGFTGATDAHANLLGQFVVEDNDIDCILYAANFRNGVGRFTNNRVRQIGNDSKFSALFWYEMPSTDIVADGNQFWFNSNGKILGNPFDLAQSQRGIKIIRNTVEGGSLVNTSLTSASLEVEVDDNTITNAALCGVQINAGSNAATVVKAKVRRNKITGATGATVAGIRLAGGTTNQRSAKFVDPVIDGNELDYSSVTATVYCIELINALFDGGALRDNRVQRNPAGNTSNIRGIAIRTADTRGLTITGNTVSDAWVLIESNSGASSTHTDLSISGANEIRQLQFTESAASSPLVFLGMKIDGNKFRRADNAEGINYNPQSGSTAMASSTRVLVTRNEFATGNGSSGSSVAIGANAVGHKFEFLDNDLLRPISDASSTFYGVWRNTLRNSAQTWRDGTAAHADGRLVKSTAPTGGTWAVGDQVFHSAPASGSPMGWVCTTAPATFTAMANLA